MKYVLLMFGNIEDARCGEADENGVEEGPGPEAFIEFDAELSKAGVLAGGFALEDPDTGVSVTAPAGGGETVVTSGPYAESREFVGGTIVIDVADIDEALKWAARCPGIHGGRVEVRAIAEY
ncbi:MAG TPA: hypothetical protein H9878_05295 [Candidatus Dietzia merdigallinarum]|nr:hypothetical protein [Candidatus Dietzia merdigallinarum]